MEKKFAVTKEQMVHVYYAPGKTREYNPFTLYRTYYGAYDETVSIDWTSDSKAFAVGCKDMNLRIHAADFFSNLAIVSLCAQNDVVINGFFEDSSLDAYSVAGNGRLVAWHCDTKLSDLKPLTLNDKPISNSEDQHDKHQIKKAKKLQEDAEQQVAQSVKYTPTKHDYFTREQRSKPPVARVTSAAFSKRLHLLVTGFEDGAFFLHEMPDFNLIHSLSIANSSIDAIAFNNTGEWIALGSTQLGQLLVWEWQSESYVLKQQGHFNTMSCVTYSPDGMYVATGGDDGKVKVWNTLSGFCFVTFNEHTAGVSGITFNQNGQVIVSASLDGTVRAFDLNRYRNFRTFTSPRPVQFSCLAVDSSGDIVAAGALDNFEIYVWSMQTGRLLEILAGHEGPVCSLAFPPAGHAILASGSWDKTVKLWDILSSRGSKETIQLNSDVLAVTYRPDGEQLAISCLNSQISFWTVRNCVQMGSIEGRHDLGYSRKDTDKITAKTSAMSKAFTTLCYTADGKCLLAAGQSKNVCIYSVADQILMKQFQVTKNMSLDGTMEFLDRRKMTEFGSLALVDEGSGKALSLPGVKSGDMATRHFKPEVRVSCVRFSPTGRAWVATSTEGLLLYSLDHNLVFDPYDLDIDITPESVKQTLHEKQYTTALMLAFRLNEQLLIQEVMENIPTEDVAVICQNLPDIYVDKTLNFIATQLESSRHVEFYSSWSQRLLVIHGPKLKQRSPDIMATVRNLQKSLTRRLNDLGKICDHNTYSLQYVISLSRLKRKKLPACDDDSDDEGSHCERDQSVDETDSDDELKAMLKEKALHSDDDMES